MGANSITSREMQDAVVNPDIVLARCSKVRLPIATLLPADSPRSEGENDDHVRALAEVETPLPAIVVSEATRRVIDGMHRLRAAALRGDTHIDVVLFDGSAEDAFLYAVRLNSEHGLPLSQKDRRAAAARIVASHPDWSDRAIATVAGLSSKTVAVLRRQAGAEVAVPSQRIGRDGRIRPVNSVDARRRASQLIAEDPRASLREIARRAGVSVGTVRNVRKQLRFEHDPVSSADRHPVERTVLPAAAEETASSNNVVGVERGAAPNLDALRHDPSLRLSETGRSLLRVLGVSTHGGTQWLRHVDKLPAHCLSALAAAARQCAAGWENVARRIEEREQRSDTEASAS